MRLQRLGTHRHMHRQHFLRGGGGERSPPGDELIPQDPNRINVSPMVDVGTRHRLFRRHVRRSSERHPHREGLLSLGGQSRGARHAEVAYQGVTT